MRELGRGMYGEGPFLCEGLFRDDGQRLVVYPSRPLGMAVMLPIYLLVQLRPTMLDSTLLWASMLTVRIVVANTYPRLSRNGWIRWPLPPYSSEAARRWVSSWRKVLPASFSLTACGGADAGHPSDASPLLVDITTIGQVLGCLTFLVAGLCGCQALASSGALRC